MTGIKINNEDIEYLLWEKFAKFKVFKKLIFELCSDEDIPIYLGDEYLQYWNNQVTELLKEYNFLDETRQKAFVAGLLIGRVQGRIESILESDKNYLEANEQRL